MTPNEYAPGAPGIKARWATGAKSAVGTALSSASKVWFTLGQGILNEVYYPRPNTPCIRDLGFLVADGLNYFSEEQRDADSHVEWMGEGVPAFRLINTSRDGRYKIEKQILADPARSTVLQKVEFAALNGGELNLYALLAPHLDNMGGGNTSWVDDFNGIPMLFAQRENYALALACSEPFTKRSAGFVGVSDGWQDLNSHKQMKWQYARAQNGNTALTAQVGQASAHKNFVLALGFGNNPKEAAKNAIASLQEDFESVKHIYINEWRNWVEPKLDFLYDQNNSRDSRKLAAASLAVLKIHESKNPPGGIVAGLATPWGSSKGDDDKIGYHVVWTRDMVEVAGGLLAADATSELRRILQFLKNTQLPDGHWPQNMWLDGTPFWNSVQMDETALPILLLDLSRREGAITGEDLAHFWPMIRAAAGYLLRNGPATQQDRWEENPGFTPFTVAAEIAALLAAADAAELQNKPSIAKYLRQTADTWHDSIDDWLYATNTDWCQKFGVEGYYERVAPINSNSVARFQNNVHIQNVPAKEADTSAAHIISPDALALVRFGLRAPDDPRILNTIKIIDAMLKVETPYGTAWHRYNNDGYGEHEDGSPFDGTGIGRAWPLLTGERAHYELAAGNRAAADKLQKDMETLASESGLLPEQTWDSTDIPSRKLFFGRPAGSAMPLAWAHAEYLKLCRSLKDGKAFDTPPQTTKRYLADKTTSPLKCWRFNHQIRSIPRGKGLRIETLAPATIRWTDDNWHTIQDTPTEDTGLGVHFADLPEAELPQNGQLIFTFFWTESQTWEGQDFSVELTD